MTDQVSYLRAQLAHRDARLEQVRAERDNQFVQEEEVLAHMRLLSSEAKDWKSRVVTEAEEALCRESAQFAQQATEAQGAMDQHYKAKWQQAEADLTALCQSNSAQVQSFASKMHETNEEHQKLHTAQETQLEAQALREAHQLEQQAAQTAQEYRDMIQELRRQADEQPDLQRLLWKRQLSQQADYRAEIHELHTELLNMKEKSEMKLHLAANMCSIDHTVPSRTVESEPENVLNTLSPGRSQRWILPHELATPLRPTSSGLSHQWEPQSSSVQVHRRGNVPHLLHAIFHQRNGEKFMVEQEMTDVNCLAAYSQEMIKECHLIHFEQSKVQMKSRMQALLRLCEPHNRW